MATSRSRETVEPVDEETERDAGRKGAPTPTRKQAEQARMQRLHPVLTKKEQKARDRQARARKRDEQYKKVEEMPERVLLRNNIDSHWSVAEFAWPVVFLLLACVLATQILPVLSLVGTLASGCSSWCARSMCGGAGAATSARPPSASRASQRAARA